MPATRVIGRAVGDVDEAVPADADAAELARARHAQPLHEAAAAGVPRVQFKDVQGVRLDGNQERAVSGDGHAAESGEGAPLPGPLPTARLERGTVVSERGGQERGARARDW